MRGRRRKKRREVRRKSEITVKLKTRRQEAAVTANLKAMPFPNVVQ